MPHLRERALEAFDRGVGLRSPHRRAMAFAALGAAEVLAVLPQHKQARALMTAVAIAVGRPAVDKAWPWPEPRLSYANAVLPEALLAAGAALDSPSLVADGLRLLGWLLDGQTRDGHLSVMPAGGRGPGEILPAFDQQPIEVAALADACARAHRDHRAAAVGRGRRARRGVVPRRQRLRYPDARPGRAGAASTVWNAPAATRTRARSPRWRCSRRCSRPGRWRSHERRSVRSSMKTAVG